MRPVIAAIVLALGIVGCDDGGETGCGTLDAELTDALDAMDADPTPENMAAMSEANLAWKAAGCDDP